MLAILTLPVAVLREAFWPIWSSFQLVSERLGVLPPAGTREYLEDVVSGDQLFLQVGGVLLEGEEGVQCYP